MHLSSAIPWGGGGGKGGYFVQDPVEVLEGDTAIKVKKFPLPDGDQTTVNLRVQN